MIAFESVESFFSFRIAASDFDAEGKRGPVVYTGRPVAANHALMASIAAGSYDSGDSKSTPSTFSNTLPVPEVSNTETFRE